MPAPLTNVTITAERTGFGVLSQNVWYAVDAPGLTAKNFIVGQTYNVGLAYSKTGKPYIKQVYSGQLAASQPAVPNATGGMGGNGPVPGPYVPPAAPVAAPAPLSPPPPAAKPPADDKMSKGDWARKDVVIARQAVIKSTLESQGVANLTVGLDEAAYLAVVTRVAETLEAWVNRA